MHCRCLQSSGFHTKNLILSSPTLLECKIFNSHYLSLYKKIVIKCLSIFKSLYEHKHKNTGGICVERELEASTIDVASTCIKRIAVLRI